ncbi:MAG: hypothetical protein ACO3A4_07575, partial [Silvanigrellaceae bacterium]
GEGTCIQFGFSTDPTVKDDEKNRNGLKGGNATFLGGIYAYIFHDDLNRIGKLEDNGAMHYEEVGLTIYDWIIGGASTAVANAPLSSYTRCRTALATTPPRPDPKYRILKDGDIVFPSSGTGDAEFHMRYRDVAGNLSSPIKYTIPKCSVSSTTLCWQ